MLQPISPALADRLLGLGGQVFARQQHQEPARGQSDLTEPTLGTGRVDGGVVRFALPRSRWTRLVGFHTALARGTAIVSAGTLARRLARRRPARVR